MIEIFMAAAASRRAASGWRHWSARLLHNGGVQHRPTFPVNAGSCRCRRCVASRGVFAAFGAAKHVAVRLIVYFTTAQAQAVADDGDLSLFLRTANASSHRAAAAASVSSDGRAAPAELLAALREDHGQWLKLPSETALHHVSFLSQRAGSARSIGACPWPRRDRRSRISIAPPVMRAENRRHSMVSSDVIEDTTTARQASRAALFPAPHRNVN